MRRIHNNTPVYALPFYDISLTNRKVFADVRTMTFPFNPQSIEIILEDGAFKLPFYDVDNNSNNVALEEI
jgi:hypothetical protein